MKPEFVEIARNLEIEEYRGLPLDVVQATERASVEAVMRAVLQFDEKDPSIPEARIAAPVVDPDLVHVQRGIADRKVRETFAELFGEEHKLSPYSFVDTDRFATPSKTHEEKAKARREAIFPTAIFTVFLALATISTILLNGVFGSLILASLISTLLYSWVLLPSLGSAIEVWSAMFGEGEELGIKLRRLKLNILDNAVEADYNNLMKRSKEKISRYVRFVGQTSESDALDELRDFDLRLQQAVEEAVMATARAAAYSPEADEIESEESYAEVAEEQVALA